jgi:hypothetical protein
MTTSDDLHHLADQAVRNYPDIITKEVILRG